jgi:hypothetical protein
MCLDCGWTPGAFCHQPQTVLENIKLIEVQEIKPEIPLPSPLPSQPIGDHKMGDVNDVPAGEGVDDDDPQYAVSSVHLQALTKEGSTEKLEAGVKKGVQLLDRLVQAFEPGKETDDIKQWLQQIELVR